MYYFLYVVYCFIYYFAVNHSDNLRVVFFQVLQKNTKTEGYSPEVKTAGADSVLTTKPVQD